MEKLRPFELNFSEQQQIITWLEKEGYLDEVRYSRAYVNDKIKFNNWGRMKIRLYLKQKGLTRLAIDEGLSVLEEAQYTKILKDLLRRKDKHLKYVDNRDRRAKLYRFALGKGFEVSLVNQCLNDLLQENIDGYDE